MKQSSDAHVVASLGLALFLAAQAWSGSPRAAVPSPTSFDVFVQPDGQIAFREGAGQGVRVVPPDALDRYACPRREAMTVGADPQARYRSFLVVANWLQDCGVREMRIAREAAGGAGLAGRLLADLHLEAPSPGSAPPICPRPPPGMAAAADDCPPPAYKFPTVVSVDQGGLSIGVGRAMKPTTLDDLAGELRKAMGSDDPKAAQILVRADQAISFGQVAELLERLTRDGYTRIGLISEEPAP